MRGRKRQPSPMPYSVDSAANGASAGGSGMLDQAPGHAHVAEGCEGAVSRVGGAGDQGSCGLPTAGTAPWSNSLHCGPTLWHRGEAALVDEITSTMNEEAVGFHGRTMAHPPPPVLPFAQGCFLPAKLPIILALLCHVATLPYFAIPA
ncbi:hypothetical protein HaLaN_12224 [Haematococcus lacustris]|uniref:Uncharacterized protein n=1 Tax=Haematococcus lacustris TaxID=44745 RepID=A0A699Z1J6_HAELA|nr:hypothetical protein HaLaN_12224 [Haematococcus lacustris]